ncbi:MAG: hypothetical protein E6Q98_18175 [Rhodospirillaceae bacterium]|nr:MAG: hypothetical protein E6Q98_18175 [Rhodospirillaceae bacterium]
MKAFTAAELAALALPEMPTTESAMIRRAKAEEWQGSRRTARGGGTEYPAQALMKVLPPPAKEALLDLLTERPATEQLPAVIEQPSVPVASHQNVPTEPALLADWQRNCADARAAILAELAIIAELIGVERAVLKLIKMADSGQMRPELMALVPVANARAGKDGSRHLSYRTLYRWRTELARDGWNGLVPLDAARPKPAPAWAAALLKLYRVPTKRSLAAVLEDLPSHLPAEVAPPSYDQARRFLKELSIVDRERGRHGPNGLLKFKAFKRRSTDGLVPLQVVTADGHTHKADVAHPIHGKPFRPEICSLLDVATRYCFGWSAGLAESGKVVMDAIRHGVSQLGLFEIFYTDNGSGFINAAMTDATLGMLGRLGATPQNSLPGRAQARGKIERFQHFWKSSARELITYNGRDMDGEARRKVTKRVAADIRATGTSRLLMSWQDFLAWCQAKVDEYNNRPHRSLKKIRDALTGKLRHMSPAEALAEFRANGWEPELVPAGTMDDLFRPYERRRTQRGEITLPWGRYFHAALVPFGGEMVRVGYEMQDPRRVWVRTDTDGRLICIAEKDANVIPEQPASALEHAAQRRAKAKLKLAERDRELALAELGTGAIEHRPETPMTIELAAQHAELEAEFARAGTIMTAPIKPRDEQDERQRFRHALTIKQAIEQNQPVTAEDRQWFEGYATTSEYRTHLGFYEDFGDAMFL